MIKANGDLDFDTVTKMKEPSISLRDLVLTMDVLSLKPSGHETSVPNFAPGKGSKALLHFT